MAGNALTQSEQRGFKFRGPRKRAKSRVFSNGKLVPEVATDEPGFQVTIIKPLRPYRGARWSVPKYAGELWECFCPADDST